MELQIWVNPFIRKYLEVINPDGIKLKTSNIYAMIFFAQYKYVRTKNKKSKYYSNKNLRLTAKIKIDISESDFVKQRMKKAVTLDCCRSFHTCVRELFYQNFFEYVNLRISNRASKGLEFKIKKTVLQFVLDYNLSEDEIKIETLIRNYGRYRASNNIDIYQLINTLEDE